MSGATLYMFEPVGHRWEYRDRSTKDPQSFKVCVTLLILLFTLTREFLHPVNFKDTFFFIQSIYKLLWEASFYFIMFMKARYCRIARRLYGFLFSPLYHMKLVF